MKPKRTSYSLSKPVRTSFSLGSDDFSGGSRGVDPVRQPAATSPVATVSQDDASPISVSVGQTGNQNLTPASAVKLNNIDGFSAPKPKPTVAAPTNNASSYQVQTVRTFSFKSYINSLMNSGLHNPGFTAMTVAITAIKGFLTNAPTVHNQSQVQNQVHNQASALMPTPLKFSAELGSASGAKTAELLQIGKFSLDHANQAVSEDVPTEPESAIELASASLQSANALSKPVKPIAKFKPSESLKNLSTKAQRNRHKIRTVIAGAVACGIIMVSGGLMYANSKNLPEGNIAGSTSLYVNTPPKEETKTEPVTDQNKLQPGHLKISSLNIDAPSVTVGLTSDNAVDVPQKISDAAWFNGSALPGKPGTTFMLGHYAAGYGGIFDNLAKIKEGDIIEVSDANGTIFKYKVTEKKKMKVADINMDNLLTSQGENRLVIMTCAGSYIAQNYTDRFIVFASPIQ